MTGNVTGNVTGNINSSGVSTITTLKVGTDITAESGIITATTFDGNLTGSVTGNVNSTGVSTITTLKVGTEITAETGIITATTFDGNLTGSVTGNVNSTGVSTVSTLEISTLTNNRIAIVGSGSTIEDSSNLTFDGTKLVVSNDIEVGTGVTIYGNVGVVSATRFKGIFDGQLDVTGLLREKINIVSGKLSSNVNINTDNGMAHYFQTNETTTSDVNIMSNVGINTEMETGEVVSLSIIIKPNGSGYIDNFTVDNQNTGITTYWAGNEVTSGSLDGLDVYSINLIKTANSTFTFVVAKANFVSA